MNGISNIRELRNLLRTSHDLAESSLLERGIDVEQEQGDSSDGIPQNVSQDLK